MEPYVITLSDGSTYTMTAISKQGLEKMEKCLQNPKETAKNYMNHIDGLSELLDQVKENGKLDYTPEFAQVVDQIAKNNSVDKAECFLFGVDFGTTLERSKSLQGIGAGRRLSHSSDSKRLIRLVHENERTKELTQKRFSKLFHISTDRYRRIRDYKASYCADDVKWIETEVLQEPESNDVPKNKRRIEKETESADSDGVSEYKKAVEKRLVNLKAELEQIEANKQALAEACEDKNFTVYEYNKQVTAISKRIDAYNDKFIAFKRNVDGE